LSSSRIRVIITKHAYTRIFERGIDKKQVEMIMNNPTETIYDRERRNYKSFGLLSNPPTKEQPYLMVVHSKFNTSVKIMTVMWKDKGGLRKHGFSKL
jgi:hypothetical protein